MTVESDAVGTKVEEDRKKKKAPIVFATLISVIVIATTIYFIVTHGHEYTDNAQLEGHVVNIASRVASQVVSIPVSDNDFVKQGDILVNLDTSELTARLQAAQAEYDAAKASLLSATTNLELAEVNISTNLVQAKGGLVQAQSSLATSLAGVSQAKADREVAVSRLHLATVELDRMKSLRAEGAITQAEFDAKQASHDQAKSQLDLAEARLKSTQANIAASGGTLEQARAKLRAANTGPQQVAIAHAALEQAKARVSQADAAVKLAELNLSFASIKAPIDGYISKRSAEIGQFVGPGTNLMAISSATDIWVVANFKEDQISSIRPNDTVDIDIDTYSGQAFHGVVRNISQATGARFSLLPPDNASGNFVKVIQRVPVIIDFVGKPSVALRIGLSAEVTVHTGTGATQHAGAK